MVLKPKFEQIMKTRHQHNIEFQMVTNDVTANKGLNTQNISKLQSDRSSKVINQKNLKSASKRSGMELNDAQSQNNSFYDSLYRKQALNPIQGNGTGVQTMLRASNPNVN